MTKISVDLYIPLISFVFVKLFYFFFWPFDYDRLKFEYFFNVVSSDIKTTLIYLYLVTLFLSGSIHRWLKMISTFPLRRFYRKSFNHDLVKSIGILFLLKLDIISSIYYKLSFTYNPGLNLKSVLNLNLYLHSEFCYFEDFVFQPLLETLEPVSYLKTHNVIFIRCSFLFNYLIWSSFNFIKRGTFLISYSSVQPYKRLVYRLFPKHRSNSLRVLNYCFVLV